MLTSFDHHMYFLETNLFCFTFESYLKTADCYQVFEGRVKRYCQMTCEFQKWTSFDALLMMDCSRNM